MHDVPGTVSKILWHFTGGPVWNETLRRQSSVRKPTSDAYAALLGILQSRELRLGKYKEVVKVRVPAISYERGKRLRRKVSLLLQSAPVCCLADIPISHLGYHAGRYGKFAIRFHRDGVIRQGFNPVFYTLENAKVLRTLHDAFSSVEYFEFDYLRAILEDPELYEHHYSMRTELDGVEETITATREGIARFLAFIKTFSRNDFASIYTEREWRSVRPYQFRDRDVAMIVLPRTIKRERYFQRFVETAITRLNLSAAIPVVPWEDLVES